MRTITRIVVSFFLVTMASLAAAAAGTADKSPSVAVLPLVTYADKDISYLEQGIRSMLTSRLVADAGVTAVDAGLDAEAIKYPQDLKKIGREKGIDYFVGGSITALGGGASLDLYVTDTHTPAKAKHFYATAEKDADIIKSIDRLAREINTAIFKIETKDSSPPSPPATSKEPAKTFDPNVHPERALLSGSGSASVLRPFRRSFRQFAKTQNLHYFVRAMAVGDIDGDNTDDIVIGRKDTIKCYHLVENRLQQVAYVTIGKTYQILDISLADLDGDKRDEIYVTATYKGTPYSAGFVLDGDRLEPLFTTKKFFIRALRVPVLGPVLAGQKPGDHTPLDKKIVTLQRNGSELIEGEPLAVPSGTDLFNFLYADVDGDGNDEIVLLDEKFFLNVFRPGGTLIWRSSAIFGGSPIAVGKERDAADSDWDAHNALYPDEWKKITVSPRILATDLNGDKVTDIVIVRNEPRYSQILANVRSYDAAEIYGLSWNGVGLDVLWRTRRIDGFITDIGLRPDPAAPDKKQILYASLIMPTGTMDIFSKATSTVLTFDIETAPSEE